ncbi:hypothetical protein LUX39_19015 [Actinomadura madurae]|nr:hypothetical protein [Actinomadura madurae]MCQ0015582.1 hypothetical protein [Actinomadura madurae]
MRRASATCGRSPGCLSQTAPVSSSRTWCPRQFSWDDASHGVRVQSMTGMPLLSAAVSQLFTGRDP